VTLANVSYATFAAAPAAYQMAVQQALATALSTNATTVANTAVQVTRSSTAAPRGVPAAVANGTVLYVRLLSPTGNISSALAGFSSLFNASAAGRPALGAAAALLASHGVPGGVLGSCPRAPPPPPVAQFAHSTLSQPMAFNIPYAAWKSSSYNPAVQSAVAEALGLDTVDVQVSQILPAARGGTVVRLSIATASTSSDTGTSSSNGVQTQGVQAPAEMIAFLGMFSPNGFNTTSGDAANAMLLAKLNKYGLNVSHVYFGDQPVGSGSAW